MGIKTPKVTPLPPPPNPATMADPSIPAAGSQAAGNPKTGFSGTILTSTTGSPPANTGKKTLLGQ